MIRKGLVVPPFPSYLSLGQAHESLRLVKEVPLALENLKVELPYAFCLEICVEAQYQILLKLL